MNIAFILRQLQRNFYHAITMKFDLKFGEMEFGDLEGHRVNVHRTLAVAR